MLFNQSTDYAVRAILRLASMPAGARLNAKTISAMEDIPIRFLLNIMHVLINAGLVKSVRGVDGGYFLARPAADITMLDVAVAMEPQTQINRCLIAREHCNKDATDYCPVHKAFVKMQNNLNEQMARQNFAKLAKKLKAATGNKTAKVGK